MNGKKARQIRKSLLLKDLMAVQEQPPEGMMLRSPKSMGRMLKKVYKAGGWKPSDTPV